MTPPPPPPAPGDAVELLTELRSPRSGRVYEIGERARVVATDPDQAEVELALADGATVETVTCRSADVATTRRRIGRPSAPWSGRRSPATA
jgi:hypothetical protein